MWLSNDSAERNIATYEEKPESGVALITSERTVEAGNAIAHFEYSASLNKSTNALFKIERGEDSNVEKAIAMMVALPSSTSRTSKSMNDC